MGALNCAPSHRRDAAIASFYCLHKLNFSGKSNRSKGILSMDELIAEIIEHCVTELELPQMRPGVPLSELGIDSMEFLALYAHLSTKLGVAFDESMLEQDLSIESLVDRMKVARERERERERVACDHSSDRAIGSTYVTSLANRYSYLRLRRRNFDDWITYCDPVIMNTAISDDELRNAAVDAVNRFDSLRLRLEWTDQGVMTERISGRYSEAPYVSVRCPEYVQPSQFETWLRQRVLSVGQGMNISGNSFVLMCVRDCPDARDRLIMMVHHVAADGISLRIISDSIFHYLKHGPSAVRPVVPTFESFSRAYRRHYERCAEEQAEYWLKMPWSEAKASQLKLDIDDQKNTEKYTDYVEGTIKFDSRESTKRDSHSIHDKLMLAIGRAYCKFFGARTALIASVSHGRIGYGGVNSGAVAGWINDVIPYLINGCVPVDEELPNISAHSSYVKGAPAAFNYLKHVGVNLAGLQDLLRPQVSVNFTVGRRFPFNYYGVARKDDYISLGSPESGSTQRVYLLSAGAWMLKEKIRLRWDFSSSLFARADMAQFCSICLEELDAINKYE